MSGRVMALYGMIFRAGPAVGAVLMGTLSEYVRPGEGRFTQPTAAAQACQPEPVFMPRSRRSRGQPDR
jgi:hypothetical protein